MPPALPLVDATDAPAPPDASPAPVADAAAESPAAGIAAAAEAPWVECGAPVAMPFCGACGEARAEPGALRLGHLAAELWEHVTALDFRLLRTVVELLRRPGSLTVAYVQGRRARYTRPLALFVLVSAGTFLLADRWKGSLGDPVRNVAAAKPTSQIARRFDGYAARHGETRAQLLARVGRSPLLTSRTANTMLVPVVAVILSVLMARRRRLLAEHALLAIHLQTFLLVATVGVIFGGFAVVAAAARVAGWLGRNRAAWMDDALDLAAPFVVAGIVAHVYAAMRRAYALPRWGAAWRAVALVVALPFALVGVRYAALHLVAYFDAP
ncbi:DUF3667 domain-containing protein [Roseisolibacter sp. H3M3-2]|uniref:DUF3667 domain-containing protein n=1 Tax=Roseisolibacter sp. H3M3-2 TaxID=3031323 RepID=UPI0023DBAF7A|nr:DUF3667 domain-containing protein [Roseisolibacter sp. H3M3-2]MDF1502256.1 DUF3667 domain-containing protein [Roseisolibacter sp. H3M3-2]